MDAVEDQIGHIRTEWSVLKERWFTGEHMDPVFEGIVRDFCVFDDTIQDIYKKVEVFMKGVDNLCEGLVTLSESTIAGLTHVDDPLIKSDCCKMKEATNQITRADAPHSAIAKLRRDMDFNIMNPMRNHITNNRNLKMHLEKRRRRLLEYNAAKRVYDDCVKRNYQRTDRRFIQAQSSLESAKMQFHEVDRHIFEWLYILEEYKGDILDSALQTLKYLQYEFFATAAHAVSGVLPARMEFRPMVEMTPDHLEAQVEMELQEAEGDDDAEVVTDFSARLIDKLAKDNKSKPGEGVDSCLNDPGPPLPVDPLSLSSLLSQGFDEGPARQALRKCQNNTQAAMDWLINGGQDQAAAPEDGVRMPTTVKRVQRLKARRRAQAEKRRAKEDRVTREGGDDDRKDRERTGWSGHTHSEERSPPPPDDRSPPRSAAPSRPAPAEDLLGFDDKPAPPPAGPTDLLGGFDSPSPKVQTSAGGLLGLDDEEPPPPTDFSKQIDTLPLPEMVSLDLTRCEKQPLPASVAAGTAAMREPTAQPTGWAALSAAPATPQAAQAAQIQQLLAQSGGNITPEQLMAAAAQLAAAQQQPGLASASGSSPAAPGGYLAAGPAMPMAPAAPAAPAAQLASPPKPQDGLASLDPFGKP
mmetsp:Transcript_68721/g.201728  ORF Transcript_68721/g.201728 Transcript_68721/m.201728 type:complete len:638 (+) Transcript_68721:221-2134(+)